MISRDQSEVDNMSVVVTVLEARVAAEREDDLRAAYAQAGRGVFPTGLLRSVLLRDSAEPSLWRIETTWRSRDDLEAMRQKIVGKPQGVLIFEAAGAEPTLGVFDVVYELAPPAGADDEPLRS
jgi:hypothetical protein